MLLLLVVDGDLADGVFQADGDLVVVRDALPGVLVVFVEAHLLVVDNAVHVMPGPGRDFSNGIFEISKTFASVLERTPTILVILYNSSVEFSSLIGQKVF